MRILKAITKDTVFFISLLLAIISTIIFRPVQFDIDFKVIIVLFDLMLIIALFDSLGILEFIAIRSIIIFKSYKGLSLAMTLLCFISSMFITNDIALITIVPITISISKALDIDPIELIIFETIAANIGSSFSPIGNPQNIYLFFHYELDFLAISLIMMPIVLVGLIMLVVSIYRQASINNTHLTKEVNLCMNGKTVGVFFLFSLTLFMINSSFNIIVYSIFLLSIIAVLDKKTLLNVDYYLLGTFLWLFIFISNINGSDISDIINSFMTSPNSTFIVSVIFSQFISNVPASLLLANFTSNYKALIMGVNIGGLGTIVASLASLISYRFYVGYLPNNKNMYLKKFHLINFKYLIILCLFAFIII